MSKKLLWLKGALLVLATGTALSLGLGHGCLSEAIQRILIDVAIN